jgi:hypothetical protein
LRAVFLAMIVWLPLVLLAAMQSFALGENKLSDLLFDFAVTRATWLLRRCLS